MNRIKAPAIDNPDYAATYSRIQSAKFPVREAFLVQLESLEERVEDIWRMPPPEIDWAFAVSLGRDMSPHEHNAYARFSDWYSHYRTFGGEILEVMHRSVRNRHAFWDRVARIAQQYLGASQQWKDQNRLPYLPECYRFGTRPKLTLPQCIHAALEEGARLQRMSNF